MKAIQFTLMFFVGIIAGNLTVIATKMKDARDEPKSDIRIKDTTYRVEAKVIDEYARGFLLEGPEGYRVVFQNESAPIMKTQTPKFVRIIEKEGDVGNPWVLPVVLNN
jgi:hypothetical protein